MKVIKNRASQVTCFSHFFSGLKNISLIGSAALCLFYSMTSIAAPSFVGSTTAFSSTNVDTITVNTPANSVGDLLLATVAVDFTAEPFDATSGWVFLGSEEEPTTSLAIYYRIADGTEAANYTFSWSGASNEAAAAILVYSGVEQTAPINAFGFAGDSGDPSTAPAVTSTVADTKVVRVTSVNGGTRTSVTGVGTNRIGVPTDGHFLGVDDQDQLLSGAIIAYPFVTTPNGVGNPGGGSNNNDDSSTATIVIAPATTDIEMTSKTVSNPFPTEGEVVTYTLTLSNNSSLAAAATISDVVPGLDSPVTLGGTAGGTCAGSVATPISCVTDDIVLGSPVTVTITGAVSALGNEVVTTNTATLVAVDDTDTSNNSATADILTCEIGFLNNGVTIGTSLVEFVDTDSSDNIDNNCTEIVVNNDFGDAPAVYGDPSHAISADLFLGAVVADVDVDSQHSVLADGDDSDLNGDDEDGVVYSSAAGGSHAEVTATVSVTNTTGSDVTVCGWLDVWDAGGSAQNSLVGADGSTCQTGSAASFQFNWDNLPNVAGFTYARFRVCGTATECDEPDEADASDGEVEDYRIDFDFTPTAVTIGSVKIESTSVVDYLTGIGIQEMSDEQLLSLLEDWDPESAETVSTAEEFIEAISNFLDPDGDGQIALIIWDTLEELGTVGFYVERKIGDNNWTRINEKMLPSLIFASMGAEYQLIDPGVQGGNRYQYKLIEQEATGRTNEYGPFEVEFD